MFGSAPFAGCTNVDPEEALRRLEETAEKGFAIVLRELALRAHDGRILMIEPGDIFPIQQRAAAQANASCSHERTWQLFTLPLQVGPYQTRLLPHEFGAIRLDRVLAMQKLVRFTRPSSVSKTTLGISRRGQICSSSSRACLATG